MKRKLIGALAGFTILSGVAYAANEKIEVNFMPLKYYFNGNKAELPKDQRGFIYNDRTYVPLRSISELLGSEVEWDQETSSIYIKNKNKDSTIDKHTVSYKDGTYRGMFADRGDIQVAVQFALEDNIVKSVSFRQLYHGGKDYRIEKEDATLIGIRTQYEELVNHLIGKDLREHINDLYSPGDIVKTEVDALSGATIRSGKVISALRDGLNRGVYKY